MGFGAIGVRRQSGRCVGLLVSQRAVGKERFSWVKWNLYYPQAIGSQGYTFQNKTDTLISEQFNDVIVVG